MTNKFKLKTMEDIVADNPFRILIHFEYDSLCEDYFEIEASSGVLSIRKYGAKEFFPYLEFPYITRKGNDVVLMNDEYLTKHNYDAFIDTEDGHVNVYVKGEDYGKEEEVKNEVCG